MSDLSSQTPNNNFLMVSLFVAFVVAMFMMRPTRLRNGEDSKPFNNDGTVCIQ